MMRRMRVGGCFRNRKVMAHPISGTYSRVMWACCFGFVRVDRRDEILLKYHPYRVDIRSKPT